MRLLIRTVIVLAIVWIGLLLSGYGVLMGSKENAAGLGIQCKYLTARGGKHGAVHSFRQRDHRVNQLSCAA